MDTSASLPQHIQKLRKAWDREKASLILTPEQAAETLTLSVSTLARMRIAGNGPVFIRLSPQKVGYRMSDLEAFLESRVRRSTSEAA